MVHTQTHRFATAGGHELELDVHRPQGRTAGTVVYLHGGGFTGGDRRMDSARLHDLCEEGLTVVAPDYRLAPESVFPAQVDDVRAAVRWVRDHPDLLGSGSGRVALWGASAGAVLAALAALGPGDRHGEGGSPDPAGEVDAVVWWFGFSDIRTHAARSPLEAQVLGGSPAHALLGADDLGTVPELVRAASPISHVGPTAPPFLIAHGDRDQIVSPEESRQLHHALVAAGAPSTLLVVGGAGHEDPLFDEPGVIAMTAAFLRTHLSSTTNQN